MRVRLRPALRAARMGLGDGFVEGGYGLLLALPG